MEWISYLVQPRFWLWVCVGITLWEVLWGSPAIAIFTGVMALIYAIQANGAHHKNYYVAKPQKKEVL